MSRTTHRAILAAALLGLSAQACGSCGKPAKAPDGPAPEYEVPPDPPAWPPTPDAGAAPPAPTPPVAPPPVAPTAPNPS